MTRKWGKFKDMQGRHHWLRMDQIVWVKPADGAVSGLPIEILVEGGAYFQVYGCNPHALMRDLTTIDKRAALTDYTGGTP